MNIKYIFIIKSETLYYTSVLILVIIQNVYIMISGPMKTFKIKESHSYFKLYNETTWKGKVLKYG